MGAGPRLAVTGRLRSTPMNGSGRSGACRVACRAGKVVALWRCRTSKSSGVRLMATPCWPMTKRAATLHSSLSGLQTSPDGLLPPRQTLVTAMESKKRQSFASGAASSAASPAGLVELLTIHRAKGLEWDVFVVGCDRAPRADYRSLAAWRFQALPRQSGPVPEGRNYAFAARDTRKPRGRQCLRLSCPF